MNKEFDVESIKTKAFARLHSGKSLLGKGEAFAPLLESILNPPSLVSCAMSRFGRLYVCFCIIIE